MKLIIFTYAPAGLGHLRVTDALASARPKDCSYVVLGSYDRFITWIHRFTSTNSIGKFFFLSLQYGLLEDLFTFWYRLFLRSTANNLYKQLLDVIKENSQVEEVQIIATHFGMAHQIGAIKEKLIKETGKKIRLVVQVTDDTYQHIWCVPGADLTMIPSAYIKKEFEKYAKEQKIDFVGEVVPYPLHINLTRRLPETKNRVETFEDTNSPINVIVPVSGAAVGLVFAMELINSLVKLSGRFKFWVLVRGASYTDLFVNLLLKVPAVNTIVGKNDNEMINLYELIYQDNLIHIEITKPSEQSFKAIMEPNRVGGSILLLTDPLGRQEVENIDFLKRHNLVDDISEISSDKSRSIRSLVLDRNPQKAAENIFRCVSNDVFKNMVNKKFSFSQESISSGEVGDQGALLFWKTVERHFG